MKKKVLGKVLATAMASVMLVGVTACGSTASTAEFPTEAVNIVCHSKEGGGSDALSREVA